MGVDLNLPGLLLLPPLQVNIFLSTGNPDRWMCNIGQGQVGKAETSHWQLELEPTNSPR